MENAYIGLIIIHVLSADNENNAYSKTLQGTERGIPSCIYTNIVAENGVVVVLIND